MENLITIQSSDIIPDILIESFVSVYYFEFDKNFYHPMETHDFWEMVYVDSGNINAVVDGAVYPLQQGQVIFHKPMEKHSHISNGKCPNNMLVVCFKSYSQCLDFFNGKIFTVTKTEKKLLSLFMEECRNALKEIPGKYDDKSPLDFSHAIIGAEHLMQCYLSEFLYQFIRGDTGAAITAPVHSSKQILENVFVEEIKEFMLKNPYSKLTLDRVCTRFSISKSGICKLFKQYAEMSPMQYYANIKITEAKRLIRTDEYTVTQISELLGYSSIHKFSRAYKNSVGFSPTEYKNSIVKDVKKADSLPDQKGQL